MRSKISFTAVLFFLFCLKISFASDGKPASFLPSKEDIVTEINLARKNPEKYALFLEKFKKNFDGKKFKRKGKKTIETKEGMTAVNEAIKYLKKVEPCQPLTLSKGMSEGARDHILNISKTSTTGHKGTDGSLPGQRIDRYGKWEDALGENICYGFNTAREIVIWMIIDDSVADRGHRINIFRQHFNFVGIHCASHPLYNIICVITFAGNYTEGRSP